jgi:hypothetical protein
MKTFIILSPVDNNDRKRSELCENQTYKNVQEFIDTVPGKNRTVCDLTNFMDDCNNQEINLENYWISYINVEEHEK